MNDQNKQEIPTAPTILPAKRRRGRPRKDDGPAKRMILQTPTPEMRQKDSAGENMLGQIVSGVIDGSFDAGYFLSVKLGNNATMLRGLVFEPGKFSPITAANDIAPQVKMYHRSQVITLQDQDNGTNKQLNVSPGQVLPSDPLPSATLVRNNQRANPDQMLEIQSQFTPLLKNLRMVEQDEVMEVFEIANQAEGPELNAEQGKCVVSESVLEPKAGEGTSTSKGQNQLMDSITQPGTLVCSDLNSSNNEIHRNNIVDKSQEMDLDQKQVESEVEKNKSNLETSLQPRELVHCELKRFEIHRAPIDTQELPTINPELQLIDCSQSEQRDQDFKARQTPTFVELNSVPQESLLAESKVQPSDPIHDELKNSSFELHYVDMPQHNVTADTQVLPPESIVTKWTSRWKRRNSPNIKEKQSSHVGTEVKVVGNEEKKASDLSDDKLELGSQCASQPADADTKKFDYAANLENQTYNSHP